MSPELYAAELGKEAFTLFLIGLTIALALSGGIAFGLPRLLLGYSPRIAVAIRLGMTVLLAAGIGLFAGIAFNIAPHSGLSRWDAAFNQAVQLPAPQFTTFFTWLTHLGDPLVLTGLCIAVGSTLLAMHRYMLAAGYVATVAANGVLNRVLKAVFERARPLQDSGLTAIEGWSFPSGHTSGTIVAYGMLAYVCLRVLPVRWRMPVLMATTAVIYSVGWSRVFLNHHYASDVIAGFISGALCVSAGIAMLERLQNSRAVSNQNPG